MRRSRCSNRSSPRSPAPADWRSCAGREPSAHIPPALIAIDAAAFAIFAFQRNDSLGFWQLPGPWADVFRFNPPGAAIALIIYAGGSILALIGGFRGLRLIEALSLIAVPFLFNLMLAIGADWHMAELGAAVTAHANLPFPAQVAIGRALTLWFIGEAILILINLVSVNRLPRSVRTHALFALSGAVAAATPLFANAAQWVVQPFLAIVFSAPVRGAGSSGPMGDRLSPDRRCARLARRAGRRASRWSGSIGGLASSRARFTARCSWASFSSPL